MRAGARTLVVEARHLDTDDRTVDTFEVEMPMDEVGQRAQLAELVARLHPDVRMRSFGDGAASFLDAEHLVVAHYAGDAEGHGSAGRSLTVRQPAQQQQQQQTLFAA